ncbi:MAG: ABC transporter ATP-binding protein [Deltaproteobacteria bacterium HGW-Deltaproteobacteria-21]|nr:MAG: ABC transporter ATP-binding protein [Deltaproteobacteria bacterium HGW-Deltaproteobacteria-21]
MLDVKDIDVYHGAIQALWQISLQVGEGELVSLIGANGAGKTTIVESIAGLLAPAAGTIHFMGVRVDREPAHKVVELGISLIPEDKGIFRGMSVLENLELGAFSPKIRKKRQEVFRFVFDLFPVLSARRKQMAGTLSGGEQQMLAIGRALMGRPKMLMCDEPSLGLAPLVVKSIFRVIEQINRSGVSVILVEQNVRAALSLAKRAYVIETGRMAVFGEAGDLANNERVRSAYLGTV